MQARSPAGTAHQTSRYLAALVVSAAGLTLCAHSANAQSTLLGSTVGSTYYSVFSFGAAVLEGDTYGDAAVKGTMTANSQSTFGKTPSVGTATYANTTTLFVNGNATLAGNMTGSYNVTGSTTGTISQASPAAGANSGNQTGAAATVPNFSSADAYALNLNSQLSANATTTGAVVTYVSTGNDSLTFTLPANSHLATYYFDVTDAQINSLTSGMSLNTNGWTAGTSGVAAPTIVINIAGTNASPSPDFYFPTNGSDTGFNANYTVWNISSSIAGFGLNNTVVGSILAPSSLLTIGSNPTVNGSTIVNGIADSGTKDNFGSSGAFLGTFGSSASAPEPASLALLLPLGAILPLWRRRRQG